MIIVGYYLVRDHLTFQDLGADFFDRRNREHTARRSVKRLNGLGYKVILQPVSDINPAPTPI